MSEGKLKKILLVEDDLDISRLVKMHLEDAGYRVEMVHNGREGLDLAMGGGYDLIILDLMLPEVDGLEICKKLRAASKYDPILMLTAKSSELDRVLGLELGADDYISKPFSTRELVARVKAMFRRIDTMNPATGQDSGLLSMGDLSIDTLKRKVILNDKRVDLTAREFDLLDYFARNPGHVFRRADLLDKVWGYGHEGYEHTVNSHINRLRAKIEDDPSKPEMIVTVWGVGYKFSGSEHSAGTARTS